MATFIIFFIPIYQFAIKIGISRFHHLMKELFLILRNFHSKIIHDTGRGDRHTQRHYVLFFAGGGGGGR